MIERLVPSWAKKDGEGSGGGGEAADSGPSLAAMEEQLKAMLSQIGDAQAAGKRNTDQVGGVRTFGGDGEYPMGNGEYGGTSVDEDMRIARANGARNLELGNEIGEAEGSANGKPFKWEQTLSDNDESEINVRFALSAAATKRHVLVLFKRTALKVVVAGEELLNGATFGKLVVDDCTWCLMDKGHELHLLLTLAEGKKWDRLLA